MLEFVCPEVNRWQACISVCTGGDVYARLPCILSAFEIATLMLTVGFGQLAVRQSFCLLSARTLLTC